MFRLTVHSLLQEGVAPGLEPLTGAAKSLCIPFEQPAEDPCQFPCIKCGGKVDKWIMYGRSY